MIAVETNLLIYAHREESTFHVAAKELVDSLHTQPGVEGSKADQLRNVVEMTVPREEGKIMLNDERRDPDIVGWNRRGLLAQLLEDARVVMSGLLIGVKCANSG